MSKFQKMTKSVSKNHLGTNPLIDSLKMKATKKYTNEFINTSSGIKLPKDIKLDQNPHTKVFHSADLRKQTMGLSFAGLRLYFWFIHHAKSGLDYQKFNKSAYMKETGISINTVKKGLDELIRYAFIAESGEKGTYWINPQLFFCGDRLKKFPDKTKVVNEW